MERWGEPSGRAAPRNFQNRISRLKAAVVYFPAFLEKGIVKEKLIFDIGGDGSSWRDCAAFCHWVRPEDPHGCGENVRFQMSSFGKFGISPRVWGKLRNVVHERDYRRNIPTGVGKTR